MSFTWLKVEEVELLHAEVIAFAGGSPGLRDRGLLESAVSRAENRAYYDPGASLAALAASLGLGLIKNHAFIDGNKRVGLAAMVVFLEINGYRFICSVEEEIEMVQKAAASVIDEQQWTAWVESVAVPV